MKNLKQMGKKKYGFLLLICLVFLGSVSGMVVGKANAIKNDNVMTVTQNVMKHQKINGAAVVLGLVDDETYLVRYQGDTIKIYDPEIWIVTKKGVIYDAGTIQMDTNEVIKNMPVHLKQEGVDKKTGLPVVQVFVNKTGEEIHDYLYNLH